MGSCASPGLRLFIRQKRQQRGKRAFRCAAVAGCDGMGGLGAAMTLVLMIEKRLDGLHQ
jgi:hypothetical protein